VRRPAEPVVHALAKHPAFRAGFVVFKQVGAPLSATG
jgi:hypothetical protein